MSSQGTVFQSFWSGAPLVRLLKMRVHSEHEGVAKASGLPSESRAPAIRGSPDLAFIAVLASAASEGVAAWLDDLAKRNRKGSIPIVICWVPSYDGGLFDEAVRRQTAGIAPRFIQHFLVGLT